MRKIQQKQQQEKKFFFFFFSKATCNDRSSVRQLNRSSITPAIFVRMNAKRNKKKRKIFANPCWTSFCKQNFATKEPICTVDVQLSMYVCMVGYELPLKIMIKTFHNILLLASPVHSFYFLRQHFVFGFLSVILSLLVSNFSFFFLFLSLQSLQFFFTLIFFLLFYFFFFFFFLKNFIAVGRWPAFTYWPLVFVF